MVETQRFVVQLLCPRCHSSSFLPQRKVPLSSGKVQCNRCGQRFQVDLAHEENCRVGVVEGRLAPVDETGHGLPQYGPYLVKKPCCEGFTYELKTLAKLIRTGLVQYHTPVLPPGGSHYVPAGEILELREFFAD